MKVFKLNCQFCNNEFSVPFKDKESLFCCMGCQRNANKSNIEKLSTCEVCKKEFTHFGQKTVCSHTCALKYISRSKILDLPVKSVKKNCLFCKKEFEYRGDRPFCSLACAHSIKPTKRSNLIKVGSKCCLCEKKDDSCKLVDSLTLCSKCNKMVRGDRPFWQIVLSGLTSGSKIVKKAWGLEIHIVNHNDYCLKYLVFFKDKQFSHHYHVLKKELWHCIHGEFECVLENDSGKNYILFKQGDKIEVEPTVKHQLQATKNSILVEVSTRSYDEDSIRLSIGSN